MNQPTIEILSEKDMTRRDHSTELLVLVRVTAPKIKSDKPRSALNLGLVLDHSGSMHGDKMEAAKEAAIYAVRQLDESDRVSVTIFDDEVETIVPSTLARNKTKLIDKIRRVRPDGSTALHAGWLEGGTQVAAHLKGERLNRVLLLTDGLANQGETNPDRIAGDVKGLATRGISTTTMGVGDDFNEDLLEQMAKSGDGNYYFIEGAADLERIFAAELSGLMATVGRKVSLGLEPQNGVEIIEVYSKLDTNELGRFQLSNLIAGNTLEVALRIRVPALQRDSDVLIVRLAYDAPESSRRVVMRQSLSLAPCNDTQWDDARADASVQSAASKLNLARERELIAQSLDNGDLAGARGGVANARRIAAAAPLQLAELAEEVAGFDALESSLDEGNSRGAAKRAKYDAYRSHQSRE